MVQGAVVVVTKEIFPRSIAQNLFILVFFLIFQLMLASSLSQAAVLPEDSVDTLYHRYEGGGMKIDGPAVLVRKGVGSNVSLSAKYYVDKVSSASVDVLATASPYSEERTEYSLGVDVLNEKSVMSLGYTQSDENDFNAKSAYLDITQDVFGDLTTVGLGVSKGWDDVSKTGAQDFSESVDRTQMRLSLSQILTKNILVSLKYELITDEGYLNNPYRQVRYLVEDGSLYEYQAEVYPNTRTSNAFSLRTGMYLPYRAAMNIEYRYFTDSWGIKAHTAQLDYVHPLPKHWVFDVKYRYYQQDHADFYADLFPYVDAQNYLARDKEMSTFNSHTIGVGVTYEFGNNLTSWVKRGDVSLLFDFMMFNYDDFRDVTHTGFSPGSEPLYEFNARVTRLALTMFY